MLVEGNAMKNSSMIDTSMIDSPMIQWPAVIKYHGADELIYIKSLAEWQHDPDLSQTKYEIEDRLIDTSGAIFSFSPAESPSDNNVLVSLNSRILVSEFVEMVRKHAVLENYCCSAKLNAKSHQQVIAMVKEINSI